MNWFLTILGYFWIALGFFTIIFTKTIKKYYGVFIEGNHPKTMGSLAILVGALLIASTINCNYIFLVLLLGVIQIIKGMYLIFMPHEKIEKLLLWWFNTSLFIYRLWGIATIGMGLILLKARL